MDRASVEKLEAIRNRLVEAGPKKKKPSPAERLKAQLEPLEQAAGWILYDAKVLHREIKNLAKQSTQKRTKRKRDIKDALEGGGSLMRNVEKLVSLL